MKSCRPCSQVPLCITPLVTKYVNNSNISFLSNSCKRKREDVEGNLKPIFQSTETCMQKRSVTLINEEILSTDSTPIKNSPSPLQDENYVVKHVDKIAHLILNNLPLRLKHLIKLWKLEEVCNFYIVLFMSNVKLLIQLYYYIPD